MTTEAVIQLTTDAPWYEQDVFIGTDAYSLEMYFNVRCNRWFLSVYDRAGVLQVAGVSVTINRPLLKACRYRLLPSIAMYALDDSDLGRQPTYNSFQTTHSLCYQPIA